MSVFVSAEKSNWVNFMLLCKLRWKSNSNLKTTAIVFGELTECFQRQMFRVEEFWISYSINIRLRTPILCPSSFFCVLFISNDERESTQLKFNGPSNTDVQHEIYKLILTENDISAYICAYWKDIVCSFSHTTQ